MWVTYGAGNEAYSFVSHTSCQARVSPRVQTEHAAERTWFGERRKHRRFNVTIEHRYFDHIQGESTLHLAAAVCVWW